jgi:hypothetical protein
VAGCSPRMGKLTSTPVRYELQFVASNDCRGSVLATSRDNAIEMAARGQKSGLWRAERITYGQNVELEGDALQKEIACRLPWTELS